MFSLDYSFLAMVPFLFIFEVIVLIYVLCVNVGIRFLSLSNLQFIFVRIFFADLD